MNYIKVKLSKRDVESIEKNLLKLYLEASKSLEVVYARKTLNMFRKRVKNGISEKKPYKRQEVYKK